MYTTPTSVTDVFCLVTYGTAQFKLYTSVQAHACACTFNACKTKKLACARTVACDFGMRT